MAISRERQEWCFQFYFASANCCIFNVLKTLKQLWNAETICFRVLFQFYSMLCEPFNAM